MKIILLQNFWFFQNTITILYNERDKKNFWYGAGISFDLNPELSLKINSLIGTERFNYIDINYSIERKNITRIFSNLLFEYNSGLRIKNKLGLVLIHRNKSGNTWSGNEFNKISYGGFVSSQFKINKNLSLSGRVEFLNDRTGLLLLNDEIYLSNFPMMISGFAVGLEYKFRDKVFTRVEFDKKFFDDNARFLIENNSNLSLLLLSMGIEF